MLAKVPRIVCGGGANRRGVQATGQFRRPHFLFGQAIVAKAQNREKIGFAK
jgi:hypothetical protein